MVPTLPIGLGPCYAYSMTNVSVKDAKWTIDMKDGWSVLYLDGKFMASTDNLEDILTFIRKWHEPVSLH